MRIRVRIPRNQVNSKWAGRPDWNYSLGKWKKGIHREISGEISHIGKLCIPEILSQRIMWKNNWGWFLISTSGFHMHTYMDPQSNTWKHAYSHEYIPYTHHSGKRKKWNYYLITIILISNPLQHISLYSLIKYSRNYIT